MKKICYVVTIPLTIRAFFIPQLKHLANNGFDVTVICSNDEKLQEELGKKIRYIPMDMPRGISLFSSISAISRLVGLFKKEKFDLVQYSTPNAALYASAASKMVGIKVRNYHLMGFRYLGEQGVKRKVLKLLEQLSCSMSTSIECVSKSNLELGVSEKIFKRNKSVVVWNGSTGGIDLNRFDISKGQKWRNEIRSKFNFSETDFVYGFVGRVTKDKGINEIFDAYFKLKSNDKLLVIGNIEEEHGLDQELLKRARECSNIIFHKSVIDIEKYYAAIDVLLLPSYREGFGNVVIESAAMGTPAIVSNIPGPIDAVIPGETAKVVSVKDVLQLKDAMTLIRHSSCVEMGQKASKYVKSHFDSALLNEFILKRKCELLENTK